MTTPSEKLPALTDSMQYENEHAPLDCILIRDGLHGGYVTINVRSRYYSTGIVDPRHQPTTKRGGFDKYKGRQWLARLTHDATQYLRRCNLGME